MFVWLSLGASDGCRLGWLLVVDGWPETVDDGLIEFCIEGIELETSEGLCDVVVLGEDDCCTLGTDESALVGTIDGCKDGAPLWTNTGVDDGAELGKKIGCSVGD